MRRILLVGLMGSGKTAVGRAVAAQLNQAYLDNDEVVESLVGSSKATLVAERGEPGLRAAEAEVALMLISGAADPGGRYVAGLPAGALLDKRVIAALLETPGVYVVWLRARVETLAARVAADPADRPWLSGDLASAIEALRPPREAAFDRVAHLIVDVDDLTPPEAAYAIATAAGEDGRGRMGGGGWAGEEGGRG